MTSKTVGVALALLMSATSATFAAGLTNSTDTAPPPSTQGTPHHAMRSSHRTHTRRLYLYAPSGVERTEPGHAAAPTGEAARDAAIHDCSTKANKWSSSGWQTTQLAVYGTCMAEHGQQG
jgi:hypothetical protein